MRRYLSIITLLLCLAACSPKIDVQSLPDASSEQIGRVEPPCWWTGMKTELQLMVHGNRISDCDVRMEGPGRIAVSAVHKADSPNYLFIDVDVPANAATGTYYLVFNGPEGEFKYPYEFSAREPGSARRTSFDTSDLIYLIMPDRFSNGDPSNDSAEGLSEGVDRTRAFGRHGGDIQGVMNHLDYIADLGATAIWFTPLLEDNDRGGSYHGYACSDYYHIDARFGDNEMFRELVSMAHARGLKIIMDIVTNHSGTNTHWWASDLPFEDWINKWPSYTGSNYAFSTHMDPNASKKDLAVMQEGWFTRGMADMNLDNPYLLQYFKQYAVWWAEWSGLDGFRVDTYPYNEKLPMSEWNKAILEEYPDINIVGECWTSSIPLLAYWQKDNPNRDGFNSNLPSIMDFPLLDAASAVFSPRKAGMRQLYDLFSNDFVYQDLSHMMIFPSNHDTYRVGDMVGKNPARFKLMMAMYATARGILQIFSGDEMMFSSSDLNQGDGGKRVDFPGGWDGDEFDFFTQDGRAAADVDFDGSPIDKGIRAELFDYCRNLFCWRKTADVIHNGRTMHFLTNDDTYAYFRYNDAETVFVFLNNSETETAEVPWSDYAEIASGLKVGTDVISGTEYDFSKPVTVPPMTAIIIEF